MGEYADLILLIQGGEVCESCFCHMGGSAPGAGPGHPRQCRSCRRGLIREASGMLVASPTGEGERSEPEPLDEAERQTRRWKNYQRKLRRARKAAKKRETTQP